MIKRIFDIVFAFLGIIILFIPLLLLSLLIIIESKGGIFFIQERIGKNGKPFKLYKLRSMYTGSEKKGLLTVGKRDARVTKIGYFTRKYKIDELPQLLNVLIGNMSFVGPRPEVKKYVDLYNERQREVLLVKPGITDHASIAYRNENELLAQSSNPENDYINKIMPDKLQINLKYIAKQNLWTDIKIIFKTIF